MRAEEGFCRQIQQCCQRIAPAQQVHQNRLPCSFVESQLSDAALQPESNLRCAEVGDIVRTFSEKYSRLQW